MKNRSNQTSPTKITIKIRFMRLRQKRLLLPLLAIILTISSCKKNDYLTNNSNQLTEKEIVARYTTVPKGLNPILQLIADKIKQENDKIHFLGNLGKRAGVPIWSGCQIKSKAVNTAAKGINDNYTLVFVPLSIPNSEDVDGFLSCKVYATSVDINLFEDNNYANYGFGKPEGEIDAEAIAKKSMELEYKIFGHTNFTTLDKKLFAENTNGDIANLKNINIGETITTDPNTGTQSRLFVFIFWHCKNGDTYSGCDHCDGCYQFSYFNLNDGNGFTGSGDGSSGGFGNGFDGGSGGSVGWIPTPTPAPEPTSNNDTCSAFIDSLQNNTNFMYYLNTIDAMNKNQQLSYEIGYLINDKDNGAAGYEWKTGQTTNTHTLYITTTAPFDGIIHTHPYFANAIFSPADVVDMALRFAGNSPKNQQNFFYGVCTTTGSPYIMKVRDVSRFSTFANKITAMSEKDRKAFAAKYATDEFRSQDPETCEKAFFNMLDKELPGALSIYRKNTTDNKFSNLNVDNYGTVIAKSCF